MADVLLIPPALATRVDAVPTGDGWLHEPKLDGYRLQCHVDGGDVVLLTRNGLDWTERFAPICAAVRDLIGHRDVVLDGEVMAASTDGLSPFQSLQQALRDGTMDDATFWVFDLLREDATDLRRLSLDERRARLTRLFIDAPLTGAVRMTEALTDDPASLLIAACRRGDEGVISKRRSAPYRGGRSRDWLKIKCGQRDEFVVIGYSDPEGSRAHFGALLLASRAAPGTPLRYAGRVGSGFSDGRLSALSATLATLARSAPAVPVPAGAARSVHWVDPVLVAEVAFAEWTVDHLLRQATFLGLREDKEAGDVRTEESTVIVSDVSISSPSRHVWPERRITKHELADYHEVAAPMMLRHLAGRPLSTLRCPDGAHGTCFFQKHWPPARGPKVRGMPVAESDGTRQQYAVAATAGDLVTLVQMNVIEFHTWAARGDALERPDRMVLDLDPGPGIGWATTRDAAVVVRDVLAHAGLQSWVKLSGGKGIHVTIPFDRRLTWQQFSDFARLVAGRLVADHPTTFVDTASKEKRTRRIFIDWLRNARGATAIAPWSVRARKNAPVSTPLTWEALLGMRTLAPLTLREAREHLASSPEDPWAALLQCRQRLTSATVEALAVPVVVPSPRRRRASTAGGTTATASARTASASAATSATSPRRTTKSAGAARVSHPAHRGT